MTSITFEKASSFKAFKSIVDDSSISKEYLNNVSKFAKSEYDENYYIYLKV